MDSYSTDSFLIALGRFMCLRGVPARIQSDSREQLKMFASKQTEAWDVEGITSWAGEKGIEWHLVPQVGSTSMGRPAE
jgi:hypothetical protein